MQKSEVLYDTKTLQGAPSKLVGRETLDWQDWSKRQRKLTKLFTGFGNRIVHVVVVVAATTADKLHTFARSKYLNGKVPFIVS